MWEFLLPLLIIIVIVYARYVGWKNRQIRLGYKKQAEEFRKKLGPPPYTCPCCGYKTLRNYAEYDICPICKWEDDPPMRDNPYYTGGANGMSLYDAQQKLLKQDKRKIKKRTKNFEKDTEWKSFIKTIKIQISKLEKRD
jgi:hypothetical protein